MSAYMSLGSYCEVVWSDSHGQSPGDGWHELSKVRKRETTPLIITSVGIVIEHNGHGILLTLSRQGTDYVDSWLHIPRASVLSYRRLK